MNRKYHDEEPESYKSDDGFTVFTAEYLLSRGYCCGNGCRHCPYDYSAVKEPKRSMLLLQRKNNEDNQKG
ncbi:MAG: hypothetical protein EOO00_03665 [Chitinophagaceae bacterium]|nr:MAG: hypothetical protein EOO00_03665 [Chitinophagaceae bacterium]